MKGQTSFSIYENTGWVGDLENIEPGQGYVYIISETRPDGTVISRSRSFIAHQE